MFVMGCKCVTLQACFTGIETEKPKCTVNHDEFMMFLWCLYIDFVALSKQTSLQWKAFFFSVCISSKLHQKLLEWNE
jgi:hypothetical protein